MGRETGGQPEFAVTYRQGVAVVRIGGTLTPEKILLANEALVQHPEFRSGDDAIWDLRDVDATRLRVDDLREITRRLADRDELRGFHRSAMVTARDVEFGITRMYEALSGGRPHKVAVFRSMERARSWLLGDEPTPSPDLPESDR